MNDEKSKAKRIETLKERIYEEVDMMLAAERPTRVMDPYQRAQDSLTKLFVLLVTGKAL